MDIYVSLPGLYLSSPFHLQCQGIWVICPLWPPFPDRLLLLCHPLFISLLFSFLISYFIASEPSSLDSGASVPASLLTGASNIFHLFGYKLKGVPTTICHPCLFASILGLIISVSYSHLFQTGARSSTHSRDSLATKGDWLLTRHCQWPSPQLY